MSSNSSNNSMLVGPPRIHRLPTTPTTNGTSSLQSPRRNSIIVTPQTTPQFGLTENGSLTYVATGNPCLDFFFQVVPDTPAESVIQRLAASWAHDPLTTLKLVCNLRGVRGTGKSDRGGFYTCALWLHQNHPKTLASNVRVIAEFGYYKDLVEVVYRLLEGGDVREKWKQEAEQRKLVAKPKRLRLYGGLDFHGYYQNDTEEEEEKKNRERVGKQRRKEVFDARIEEAKALRRERIAEKGRRGFQRYTTDDSYRFLHDCISEAFAVALKQDMIFLEAGQVRKISLAAKWCPSIDSTYDNATLMCESIARRVFPRESYPEYEGITEAHYVYRVRDRLRKQALVPLRKVLELPEVYMSSNQWESLPYNKVPSVAMKNYKEQFLSHDGDRFRGYLEDVKKGEKTITAGALLPHEIIASLGGGEDGGEVAELQWERMVKDLSSKGKLNNCIAVCDVSGSMRGIPMEVCVSLGLLISELSEEPWKGKVITFSQSPELHLIKGTSLLEKTSFIRMMQWDMNTDFQKVFDRILEVAVNGGLSDDRIIKRVFVFSDMEFDEAYGRNHRGSSYYDYRWGDCSIGSRPAGWETDYQVIERKFREKGFNKVPEIVFWNLRESKATPVASNQKGVALVSGFSKNMVKLFLDNDGSVDPVMTMQKAISGELYEKLIVCD